MAEELHYGNFGNKINALGGSLGKTWGTKRNTWGTPGATSQPDNKNNKKNTFW